MPQDDEITALRLTLASPEQIRSWSSGEVREPEGIHSLTGKPVPGGLFCERIFGPIKDWSCTCGKYRRDQRPGAVCERCGVALAPASVRRERLGHIELAVPVAHPWFARGTGSSIALLLDLSIRQLSTLLSYQTYLVTAIDEDQRTQALAQRSDPGESELADTLRSLSVGMIIDGATSFALLARYDETFAARSGAQAIRDQLERLDLAALVSDLRHRLQEDGQLSKHELARLRLAEAMREASVNPAWMVLTVLPVLPPDLRPLVPMDGGRYASSDLNTLYERVIHRNNRIKCLQEIHAPEVILNHEKRLLQDACDALLDNGHRAHPTLSSQGHPLKSLTDTLSGKGGRFRHNLLGKRVDYSGRSVIVGDPTLSLSQCGLPTKICLELFKPFLIRKLVERHGAPTPRAAKRLIERTHRRDPVLWDLLEEVMHEKVVLLNRAPTLHRLSIQAFEARRVEGQAIRLHPLVCSAFNADFDGDQMAVHLPLSDDAQAEARALLLSTRNLRSPATGDPAITLAQEVVLGLFYLTQERPSQKSAGRIFADATDAQLALEHGIIDLHTRIVVRLPDPTIDEAPPPAAGGAPPKRGRLETTVGRLIFNEALPAALRYKNDAMTKEYLKQLLSECLRMCGPEETARVADRLKTLGFHHATKSGISFAISDIPVPPAKEALVREAKAETTRLRQTYENGMLTGDERDQAIILLWTQATAAISACAEAAIDPWGSLATIIESGATKAKFQQIRQLSGIRGLMVNAAGRIIPIPITGNYLEGLIVLEIFLAALGARKGFMDRSLNTARSGYLTRRLVEAAMDVWITMRDCRTMDGLLITEAESKAFGLPSMRSRLLGRLLAADLPQVGLARNTLLTEAVVDRLLAQGVAAVRVRSPLTCEAPYGLCQHCYGLDLSTGFLVRLGTAVGIIAAQSVGEPGTQLTMRTFHAGGIANAQGDITQGLPRVEELFEVRTPHHPALLCEQEGVVHVKEDPQSGTHTLRIGAQATAGSQDRIYTLPAGTTLAVAHGQAVEIGTPLTVGPLHPQELLHLVGREAVARYLVQSVQHVYRGTGVFLHDKHVECIVRQMVHCVMVDAPGETPLLPGAVLARPVFLAHNAAVLAQGGRPALGHPVLLGLTRAALATPSWIAAASFQQTSRVLAQAALRGQRDDLVGFKERTILGKRLPTVRERAWRGTALARSRPTLSPSAQTQKGATPCTDAVPMSVAR